MVDDGGAGTSHRILGRSEELDRIEEMVQRLAAGRGSVVVLIGPPGIGLTTLLRESIVRAGDSVADLRAVHVPSGLLEGDAGAAMSAIASGGAGEVFRRFAESAEQTLSEAGAAMTLDDPRLIRVGVDALRTLSDQRPLLVTVDDLPVDDASVFNALTSLAAGIADLPVMVAATSHVLPRSSFEDSPVGPLWVRQVPPLAHAEAVELARAAVGSRVPYSVAADLVRRTGAVPGDLRAVCGLLGPDQLAGTEPLPAPLPGTAVTSATYRRWWQSLGPQERLLVLGAAVAVRPDRAALEECAGVTIDEVTGQDGEPVLREENGLVTADHPRLLSAVHALSTPHEVRAAQSALASCYPEGSLDRQWLTLRSGATPTPELVRTLVDGAGTLLDRGEASSVQTLVDDVAQRLGETAPPVELLLLGGVAATYCGHPTRAVTLLTGAVGAAPAALERTFPLLLTAMTLRDKGVPHRLVASSLDRLAAPQPAAAASIAALAARLCARYGDEEGSRRYLEQAESLRPVGADATPDLLAELALTAAMVEHHRPESGPSDPLAVLAVRRPGLDLTGWMLELQALAQLIDSGAWVQARGAASDLYAQVRPGQAPLLRAELAMLSVRLHLSTCQYRRAQEVAVAAAEEGLPLHVPEGGAGIGLLAQSALLGGHTADAEQWLSELGELARGFQTPPVLSAALHEAQGLRAQLAGVPAEAAEHLARAVRAGRVLPTTLIDLASHLHRAGPSSSAELVEVVSTRLRAAAGDAADDVAPAATLDLLSAPAEGLVAVVAAVERAGRDSTFPAHVAQVLELAADRLGALTAEEYAAQAHGDPDLPTQRDAYRLLLLQRARQLYDKCAAAGRAQVTDREIERLERAQAPAEADITSLTEDELRVARFVHRGLTNGQIASALYVSVRTVELRLTSTYRKLGIRSRRELRQLANLATTDQTPS
ncbi:helix-turn-helix transcriptional regulator [Georgenia subflava]|uniref:AAA family ATPase n=1 Tax=Georgenia subflava TaxID=1622177 RepID=A0A6N7EK51_9MICO|nr:LuxR family transcriptional regulator [Georgenia subflava]MPV36576.1 AAA family ATPase [Georgenia subflava]